MADEDSPPSHRKILAMVPRRAALEKRVHELAEDSGNIIWTDHFWVRADERGFTTLDALRILRAGFVGDEIKPGKAPGEWKCKLTKKLKGRREAGVVVIVINNQGLSVTTIEWEDWRGQ
jgi:hypothetical protein